MTDRQTDRHPEGTTDRQNRHVLTINTTEIFNEISDISATTVAFSELFIVSTDEFIQERLNRR